MTSKTGTVCRIRIVAGKKVLADIGEEWRPIERTDGQYEVSSLGRIRSVDRTITNAAGRTAHVKGRIRVIRRYGAQKYATVSVTVFGERMTLVPHREVCEAFSGPKPGPKMHAAHEDGDSDNNRAINLSWKTASENNYDIVRHGRHHVANRTRCPLGHELVEPNLVDGALRAGCRSCKACHRARAYLSMLVRDGRPQEDLQALAGRYYVALGFERDKAVA